MIRLIDKKTLKSNPINIAWIFLIFLSINYMVFLALINVSFESLIIGQPVYLTIITLSLLGIDLLLGIFISWKFFKRQTIMDLVIWICLIISFSLYHQYPKLVYLQIVTVIKLIQIFPVNEIFYNLIKQRTFLFKIYVLIKIIYWIVLVGQFLGCCFYALDIYLIETAYFGQFSLNPQYYYQGALHAYSPIYGLSQPQRYIYAIYYSYSLLSTCAFGDIIGRNYIEDVLTGAYLIISTIGISLIIEQMYIVFRRQKTQFYGLTQKLKFVSQYIKSHNQINYKFRHQLMNYMIYSQWIQVTQIAPISSLTQKLQQNIFSQSILSKTQQQLPLIIKKYFLFLLKPKFYPADYFLINYNNIQNHSFGYVVVGGQVELGYTKQLIGKLTQKKQCVSFGFDQLVIGTNFIQKYLTIKLIKPAQVYVLSQDIFNNKIQQFKAYFNQFLPTPTQYYQISKDQIICRSRQRLYCFSCKKSGHSLTNCRKFHYNPGHGSLKMFYEKHFNEKRNFKFRRTLSSKKNTSMKCIYEYRFGSKNISKNFGIISKIFDQNHMFQNLLSQTFTDYKNDTFAVRQIQKDQTYHVWKAYAPQGKL